MNYELLLETLGDARIFIQTHDYPDPDAMASAFGLQQFLAHFGRAAELSYQGEAEQDSVLTAVRECQMALTPFSEALKMQETDTIVLVDAQKSTANVTDLPGRKVACLDHHPISKPISKPLEYAYTDIRPVGACSSIIAEYYFTSGVPMPTDVATMLLFGLHTDTSFMTRGVAELDFEVFPRLYRLADQKRLEGLERPSLACSDLTAFGRAIDNIEIFGRAGFVHLLFACPDLLMNEAADCILSLNEVDIAVLSTQRPLGLKYSVRSVLPEVHSGAMLAWVMPPFGTGGGHAEKAGGSVSREAMRKSGLGERAFVRMLERRFLTYITSHTKEAGPA